MIVLNDEEIVRLYYERSEDGIAQSEQKYGRLCRSVIRRILPDERDAEECLSDVWIRTWNSIPPEKPRVLGAFLARIARNLALDKLSYNGAGKRASALTEAFEELDTLDKENRVIFVRRYWYGESVSEIAAACGCSAEKVKSSLFRTRNRLREAMLKEDIAI